MALCFAGIVRSAPDLVNEVLDQEAGLEASGGGRDLELIRAAEQVVGDLA